MIISKKEQFKLSTLSLISFCTVFVCHLFLNYGMDLAAIKSNISPELSPYYESQQLMVRVISYLTGACLALISILLLGFYVQRFIDKHKKELGILKALGYSAWQLAFQMSALSIPILVGTSFGFLTSFLMMNPFYQFQNEKELLPEVTIHFHWELLLTLTLLPSLFFFLWTIYRSYRSLQGSAYQLLSQQPSHLKKRKSTSNAPFLQEMRKASVVGKPSLLFFLIFSSFCYSSMTQMAFGILKLATNWIALMMFIIGFILAATILILALEHVLADNKEALALMRIIGYSDKECRTSILDGFRPFAWLGFLIGSLYQFGLLQLLVFLIFKESSQRPSIDFDWQAFGIAAITFLLAYEALVAYFAHKIKQQSFTSILLG